MTERTDCIALIHQMPDKGMEECLSTLKDMMEFYSAEPSPGIPLATTHHLLPGRLVETVERPPLEIPTEFYGPICDVAGCGCGCHE